MLKIKQLLRVCLVIVYANFTSAFLDPLSIGVGVGSLGLNFMKDQTYCRIVECCNEQYIPGNVKDLKERLQSKLFGQHIVLKELIPALKSHFSSKCKSKKPLVISFHGTQGTGKNFVADMVAEALYKNGLKSKYVHKYLGRADFPVSDKVAEYKERIDREVRTGIADCPHSLFIFDEVEKMPIGVFDALTALLDYNEMIDGHDYTKAIFIFLSNTAGVQISDRLIKAGNVREHSKLSDFEQILEKAAFNLDGGLQKTSLIESHVIDHYLPFLPLEKAHISKCVQAEYQRWDANVSIEEIDNIIKDVVTYDPNHHIFVTAGCKRLDKKVAVAVAKSENYT